MFRWYRNVRAFFHGLTMGWSKERDGLWRCRNYEYTPKQLIFTRDYIGVIRDADDCEILHAIDLEGIAIADTEIRVLTMTQEQYESRPVKGVEWEHEETTENDIVAIVMDYGFLRLTELNFEDDARGIWHLGKRCELPVGFEMTWLGCEESK